MVGLINMAGDFTLFSPALIVTYLSRFFFFIGITGSTITTLRYASSRLLCQSKNVCGCMGFPERGISGAFLSMRVESGKIVWEKQRHDYIQWKDKKKERKKQRNKVRTIKFERMI